MIVFEFEKTSLIPVMYKLLQTDLLLFCLEYIPYKCENSHKSYVSQFPLKITTKGGWFFFVIVYITISGIFPIREDFRSVGCCDNWIIHLITFHIWCLEDFSMYCLWLSTFQTLFVLHSSHTAGGGAEGHAYTSTWPQALYLRTEMVSDKHVPESHFCSGVAGG